jgi:hypothetical protein
LPDVIIRTLLWLRLLIVIVQKISVVDEFAMRIRGEGSFEEIWPEAIAPEELSSVKT